MDSSTVFDRTQYSINKSLGSPAAIKSTFPEYSTITILTGSLLSKGQKYTITLGEGISSCSGQTLEKQTLDFAITELPEPGDITINELLFNAREDSTEFIELVNISLKALDIGALALANRDLRTGNIKNVVSLLPFANLVFPGQYIVFTKNEKSLNDYYKIPPDARIIPIPKMPSLPDDEGRICILSASGSIIDEFHYHDNMHFELLQSTDGVSLEKINLRRPSSIKTNWHSASSTAGYATPGYTNSQSITDSSGTSTFALNKQNFSPDNDGIDDLLQLNYSFPCPGYEATVTIFNTRGFLMKRLLTNELMETTGIITWDGTNDQGDVLPPGIYFITCKAFNTKASTLFAKWSCTLSTR
jgi:hypothetical protein